MIASSAVAQDWSVTTSDFKTRSAVPVSLSSTDAHVQFPGQPDGNTILLTDFVSFQRSGSEPGASTKFLLLLANGDRLIGDMVKVADEQLFWRSPSLGEIKIPLNQALGLLRDSTTSDAIEPPKQDIITLANGDTITGVFLSCSDEKITIRTDNGAEEVPVTAVTRVLFASIARPSKANAGGFRIRLTDGSSITAPDATLAENQLTFTLDQKPARKVQAPLAQVTSIEQLNGPISWLSSRIPSQNEQIPYFAGAPAWPAQMDTTVDGLPIRFNAQRFEHGIGVHTYSRLTYTIEPGWKSFRTQYSIDFSDETSRPLADMIVRIKLDGKTVYEKVHFRAGVLAPVVQIDLDGAKELTLEADYGAFGDTQDHLNWIEPALVR